MSDIMGDFEKEITERVLKKQAQEIALNLIKNGITSLECIADATGLTLAEVEELAKKMA